MTHDPPPAAAAPSPGAEATTVDHVQMRPERGRPLQGAPDGRYLAVSSGGVDREPYSRTFARAAAPVVTGTVCSSAPAERRTPIVGVEPHAAARRRAGILVARTLAQCYCRSSPSAVMSILTIFASPSVAATSMA